MRRFLDKARSLAKVFTPNFLQVSSLAVVSYGLYMRSPWIGVVAAGVCLGIIGFAVAND